MPATSRWPTLSGRTTSRASRCGPTTRRQPRWWPPDADPREAAIRQLSTTLTVPTRGRGFTEITASVSEWVARAPVIDGLLTLFIRHTSASLLVQENADPDVRGDLERFFARLVKDGDPLFVHRDEGPDDMPSHVRAALTAVQLSIPFTGKRLALGTWQGIYVWEHRTRPHRREVVLHLLGE